MNNFSESKKQNQEAAVDEAMIARALELICEPGGVYELRMLSTAQGTILGYFDDMAKLLKVAKQYSGKVPGVYITLNPVHRDLLARLNNRVKIRAKSGEGTDDKNILRRRWFPIDVDYERPAGISSTDKEHELAQLKGKKVRAFLKSLGWPDPIHADSGNGDHSLYQIDLPNDNDSRVLIEKCLKALDFIASDKKLKIDVSVSNAARIWKLYGTQACKGENMPERPHRLARILDVPSEIGIVTREMLERLAAMLPEIPKQDSRPGNYAPFDIQAWMVKHEITAAWQKPWQGGTAYILEACPFNPEHNRGEARIIQFGGGALSFGCFHNSCNGNNWAALRDKLEPGWRERKYTHGNGEGKNTPFEFKTIPWTELIGTEAPEIEFLVEDLLPTGALIELAGKPKLGKSLLAMLLSISVGFGEKIWNREVKKGRVLFVSPEDGRKRLQNRLWKMLGNPDTRNPEFEFYCAPLVMTDPGVFDAFRAKVLEYKPTLIVLDPFIDLFRDRNINDPANMNEVLRPIQNLAKETGACVLLVVHTRKSDASDEIDLIQGTSTIAGVADGYIILKSLRRKDDRLVSIDVCLKDADVPGKTVLRLDENLRWGELGEYEAVMNESLEEEVVEILEYEPNGLPMSELIKILDVKYGRLYNLLKEMVMDGALVTESVGRSHTVFFRLKKYTNNKSDKSEKAKKAKSDKSEDIEDNDSSLSRDKSDKSENKSEKQDVSSDNHSENDSSDASLSSLLDLGKSDTKEKAKTKNGSSGGDSGFYDDKSDVKAKSKAHHSDTCDCETSIPEDNGNGSFEMVGNPITVDVKTVQKARSRAGAFIYGVTEPQSNGVARTRWVYPSDKDYKKIEGEWEGSQ